MTDQTYIICHECDLLISLPDFSNGNKASCPRCNYILTVKRHNSIDRVIAFSLTALIFLTLSFFFPFLTFIAQGQERSITLLQSMVLLISENYSSLAITVFTFTIVIPCFYLINVSYAYVSIKRTKLWPYTDRALKLVAQLQHWNMAEIFLIGILVSFIKIASLAEVKLGISFIAYTFFIFSMTAAVLHIDKHQIWKQLHQKKMDLSFSLLPNEHNVRGCHVCTDVSARGEKVCGSCGADLHERINHSVQKTWALLIAAICFYLPANFLPIMHTTFLGDTTANTIMGGVIVLWGHGSYPIALVIFIASVLVPIGKIIALSWLCFTVQRKNKKAHRQRTALYRLTELVGRWSMVDVFVVVILVALIQLDKIMSIYPGIAAVAFAGMVILTMLAAINFDPRLIWDSLEKENNHE